MKESGKLYYKCRLCGITYANEFSTPSVTMSLIAIIKNNFAFVKDWIGAELHPSAYDIHNCKYGGKGVADIIGGQVDD